MNQIKFTSCRRLLNEKQIHFIAKIVFLLTGFPAFSIHCASLSSKITSLPSNSEQQLFSL